MKRILILTLALLVLAGCEKAPKAKVMARYVPERADDFVFENDLVAGRFYGKALEGNPTSPGIDVWVKKPGKLVADDWYKGAMEDPDYYHHDHGGKDCYKVAVSLGGGASAPLYGGELCYPETNYRSFEMVEETPDKVTFILHYPAWSLEYGLLVTLDKKITVTAGSYFCDVEDTYVFTGAESLTIAVGVNRHPAQNDNIVEILNPEYYALWEPASDQSIEPEDGMLGVAVVVPDGEDCFITGDGLHGVCVKEVRSDEPLCYKFGSCWSKGNIKDMNSWFDEVKKQL